MEIGGDEGEGASYNHTAVTDKMYVCQLSYSLGNIAVGHIGPLNECFCTMDFIDVWEERQRHKRRKSRTLFATKCMQYVFARCISSNAK